MVALLVIFGLGVVALIVSVLRNRVMFKIAARNIPRRPIQTSLILLGLMLAAMLFSASFSSGDTIAHSLRNVGVRDLGEVDIEVVREGVEVGMTEFGQYGEAAADRTTSYFDQSYFEQVREILENDPDLEDKVEGVAPAIHEVVPVVALDTELGLPDELDLENDVPESVDDLSGLGEPVVELLGLDPQYMEAFDPLINEQGNELPSVDHLSIRDVYVDTEAHASTEVYVSTELAEELQVGLDDEIYTYLGGTNVTSLIIAGIYVQGGNPAQELSMVMSLPQLQSLMVETGAIEPGQITAILITNQGDALDGAAHTDAIVETLELEETGLKDAGLKAEPVKQEALEMAEGIGSTFCDLYLTFGSFAIIAGMLLIFLIFVMLAAERKSELGIARAVGTQRGQIVRMFTYEGVLYVLIASALGSALGLVIAWATVQILGGITGQTVGFEIIHDCRPSSLILAYTMGVVLTLLVVGFSAWYVSRLNIVRAIRDIPDPDQGARQWGIKGLVAVLLLIMLGGLLLFSGIQQEQGGSYLLGGSFVILGLSLLARQFRLSTRAACTLAGAGLLAFYLSPTSWHPKSGEMSYGMETFVLCGVMMVTGAVLVVMYNSDLLLKTIMFLFGRLRILAPVLRTAISYPMALRFRTGMVLAMFSMVVFTLVYISILSASQGELFKDTDRVSGGFHIKSLALLPITDNQGTHNVKTALEEAYAADPETSVDPASFETIATFSSDLVKMRQTDKEQAWGEFLVSGVDTAYTESIPYNFDMMAEDYDSPEQVWQTLAEEPSVVVVSAHMVPGRNTVPIPGAPPALLGEANFFLEDTILPEMYVEAQEPASGEVHKLHVIGVIDIMAGPYAGQVMTSQDTFNAILAEDKSPNGYMFQAKPGADVPRLAEDLERQFLMNGMDTDVIEEEIKDFASIENMVFDFFQGFLGLGLIIGMAALGVIAARSVVERRQQIGMLRALGFQRGMVQFSFLLESSFITLLAIGLGLGLGIALSYKAIPYVNIEGIQCVIPWARIGIIIVIAYVASLVTTYLPARQAASVHPAEALRCE